MTLMPLSPMCLTKRSPETKKKKVITQSRKNAPKVTTNSVAVPAEAKFMAVAIDPGPANIGVASGVIATSSSASRLFCLSCSVGC